MVEYACRIERGYNKSMPKLINTGYLKNIIITNYDDDYIAKNYVSRDNNCNYCDQPLRVDKNNRCICCGAQK